MNEQTFIGNGKVLLKKIGGTSGFIDCGNINKLDYSVTMDSKSVANTRNGEGGEWAKFDTPTSAEITAELADWSDENVRMALGSVLSSTAAGSVVDEVVHLYAKDTYLITEDIVDTIDKITNTAGTTTYAADVDYILENDGSIYVPSTSSMVIGDLKVSYIKKAQSTLEVLQQLGEKFELVVTGLNRQHTDQLHRLKFNKVQVAPSSLSLISNDFGSITVKFTVLNDPTKGWGQFKRVK